jgi:predicted regulator of Ras-like GTPase activity (Roadblock/LC7/MglB family)
MDVGGALERLLQDSSQVERAVVLDGDGSVLGSTLADGGATERLASAGRDLAAAAAELHAADEVTRVEVELAEGAVVFLRDGERAIVAVTGAHPTAGLVAYDLRTCLHALEEAPKPKRRRAKKAEGGGE